MATPQILIQLEEDHCQHVEFRCMIQDILGNEIYTQNLKFADRTIFLCITIPGENQWVRRLAADDLTKFELSGEPDSFPIPDSKNKSCLIKVYDADMVDSLRVNDIVRVSGFVEPTGFEEDAMDQDFERFVPSIHVRTLRKLTHINPLPAVIDLDQLGLARARLTTILTELLGGDMLMTEYLILLLISKVYKKEDVTVGQLSMCFSGFKPEMNFLTQKLYEIISKITTHSHFIDLSLANLNNLRFTPNKDHENNKLIAGTLQLPDGLFLMLNEVALSTGMLTAQGTSNVNALNNIIKFQKHKYNFQYHSVEIDTDLKILVVAEGNSILPVPITVKIKSNDAETIGSMRQACEAVDDFLPEDLLNMFRSYMTSLMDHSTFKIPDDISTKMTEDFANWRADDAKNNRPLFSADDFSIRITLARYLTLSHGKTALTRDIWERVCQMETSRLARL